MKTYHRQQIDFINLRSLQERSCRLFYCVLGMLTGSKKEVKDVSRRQGI
ncbi:hypothetical protein HMPREF1866_00798 [Lachnoanaerobaculum saburreum]|uniref:Uncharacterized protein n=1 Tax=Lachnoanaerobaculum saburreum TaxID=467210 RepID=A0A133ZX50_9FIRM|nr:hypothetical protein HMPREF1866_00798 [Lachnoanaerobaculum saburreum]